MLLVLVGLAAAAAAFALYFFIEKQGTAGLPLALLRALAWGTVAALLVNPALRRIRAAGPTVLLDASLSMTEPGGTARWSAALDSARRHAGGGRIVLFGERPRALTDSAAPSDARSLLLPALGEAAARGGPIIVVTDGAIDDAGAVPADLLRRARVVLVPRDSGPDAGVAALDVPPALRAGDTARVTVDVAGRGPASGDTVLVELLEQGRPVARTRVALADGVRRLELAFVPAPVAEGRELRRYEARLTGMTRDVEPRDDSRRSAAAVTRGATIALFSDTPDWDFRRLSQTVVATSGVPVRVFVRLSAGAGGGWRDAHTLRAVSDADLRQEAARASLLVLHGTAEGLAPVRRLRARTTSVIDWGVSGSGGDWYVVAPEFASPIGGALAGVPVESLPPLEAVGEAAGDSVAWTGLLVQQDRRGRSRPVIQGHLQRGAGGERRTVFVTGSGFWRWASRGGAAAEAYRALVASLTDWLLEERARAPLELIALRDSLARGASEFLPRDPVLAPQAGIDAAAAGEPVPLRHSGWIYGLALAALLAEWIARRRKGLR